MRAKCTIMAKSVTIFRIEILIEICPNGLIRASCQVFLMKMGKTSNKVHKSVTKWPLFVIKSQLWWCVSIIFNDNKYVFSRLSVGFHALYLTTCPLVFLFLSISVLQMLTPLTIILPFGSF